ncbi:MAG: O-antigen ligase family protein, partial [Chloroflexi bacterium]|nr:O-antigen ligase family protein [Chloroflexota bacterium]
YLERLFTLQQYFGATPGSRVQELSLQGRQSENLAALEMFKAHPLFGVGVNSYMYLFPEYSKRSGLAVVATEREAHNLYLETLAETGLIGFMFFGFLMFTCYGFMLKSRKVFLASNEPDIAGMITAYMAGFSGYFFAAIFLHNGFPRYFYLTIGMALAVHMVAEYQKRLAAGEQEAGMV